MNYFNDLEKFFEDVLYHYNVNTLINKLGKNSDGKEKINKFVKFISIETFKEDCDKFIDNNLCDKLLGIERKTLIEFLKFWEKKHNLWHIYGNDLKNYYPYYYILVDSLLNNTSIISLFDNNISFEEIDKAIFKCKGMGYIRLLHSISVEERYTKLSPVTLFSADSYKPNYFIFIDALHLYSYTESCKIVEKLIEGEKSLLSKEERIENHNLYQKCEGILNKIKEDFSNDKSDYIFDMPLCERELDKRIENCLELTEFLYDAFVIPTQISNKYKGKLYSI